MEARHGAAAGTVPPMTTPQDGSLARELAVAERLARAAGRVILEVYAAPFDVVEKPDDEGPVTEADRRANALIVDGLREAFPDDGVVAEESGDRTDPTQVRRCWFVDPLDGTREFVARNGEFAVHIGLAVAGEAQLGVIYVPAADKLYAGVVGAGCMLTEGGRTRPLVLDAAPRDALRLLASRSRPSARLAEVAQLLGADGLMPCGSVGVKCGRIAEGLADAYLHLSQGGCRWDACAPEAVLRAAGGAFVTARGEPFRYDTFDLVNRDGMVGASPWALQRLRERLWSGR